MILLVSWGGGAGSFFLGGKNFLKWDGVYGEVMALGSWMMMAFVHFHVIDQVACVFVSFFSRNYVRGFFVCR